MVSSPVRILVVLAGYDIAWESLSYRIAPVSASISMALPDTISGATGQPFSSTEEALDVSAGAPYTTFKPEMLAKSPVPDKLIPAKAVVPTVTAARITAHPLATILFTICLIIISPFCRRFCVEVITFSNNFILKNIYCKA